MWVYLILNAAYLNKYFTYEPLVLKKKKMINSLIDIIPFFFVSFHFQKVNILMKMFSHSKKKVDRKERRKDHKEREKFHKWLRQQLAYITVRELAQI